MEKQKPAALDAPLLLLALRCSRASLLLSSFRHPRAPPRATTSRSSSSSAAGCSELRDAGLLRSELAAARLEATMHAVASGAEVLLVLSLVPVLLLLLGLLTAVAVAA